MQSHDISDQTVKPGKHFHFECTEQEIALIVEALKMSKSRKGFATPTIDNMLNDIAKVYWT